MQNPVAVSVVVPSYNRATYIERCLRSIAVQSYAVFEIIVIDDCSTDQTEQVVKNLGMANLIYIKLAKNSGAQAARNAGILNAKANWLAFLDSDDEWKVDALQKMLESLQRYHYHEDTIIYGDGEINDAVTGLRSNLRLPNCKQSYAAFLQKPSPMFQGLLVSKKALLEIGLLDEKIPSYQEWETVIRLSKSKQFIHIQEPLFIYHHHAGETISKNSIREVEGYDYVINKHKQAILSELGPKGWVAHQDQQLRRCLDYGLWKRSDQYFSWTVARAPKLLCLKLLRLLHIRPRYIAKIKQIVYKRRLGEL
ncbi:MAG: glycosyltransferase involved in cell wall biosis [Gammaproteobacteria bacterium]|jgi:glycosyltransferase involved in cell wall biosynthesis|nr:glycosyltransferase involved in cell wall biosis [Gammaproteobacteria bacterium]